ncbi:MAG: hypothetical protein JJ959_16835 [Nisaea sp.]|uniref:hypothetical protein n=1 Tax=Nisaea sp. TaxID=2024842 RepID=UPI001B1D1812|nr:hypothetical protein [Nisaea sp.]MBO6562213.1 hypothetical protein [Nisaea sp.]
MAVSGILNAIDRKDAFVLLETPSDSKCWDLTGQQLIRGQDVHSALRFFKRSTISGPPYSENSLYRLAMAFELTGDFESAADHYVSVARNGSAFSRDALRRAVGCFGRLSQWDRIVDLMSDESASEWVNFNRDVAMLVGIAFGNCGRVCRAISWLCIAPQIADRDSDPAKVVSNLLDGNADPGSSEEVEKFIQETAHVLFAEDWLARKVFRWILRHGHHEALERALDSHELIQRSGGDSLGYTAAYHLELKHDRKVIRNAGRRALIWQPDHRMGIRAILPNEHDFAQQNAEWLLRWAKVAAILPNVEDHTANDAAIALKFVDQEICLVYLERLANRFKTSPRLLYNIASHFNEKSFAETAYPMVRRAILMEPAYAKALSAYSVSRSIMLDPEPGVVAARRALVCDPSLQSGHTNLAMAYRGLGNLGKAIEAGLKQLEYHPRDAVARMGVAFNQLTIGAIEQGFHNYRSRWAQKNFPSQKRPFPQREWALQKLPPGKKALIYMEQGMGDELMFSWFLRYADAVVPGQLVVECDSRLVAVFERSFPSIEFRGRDAPVDRRLLADDVLYKLPIGHLPSLFTAELRTLIRERWALAVEPRVAGHGWIVPDPDGVAHWKSKVREIASGDRLAIGVAWRSGQITRTRKLQYLAPEELAASLPDNTVAINLQYVFEDDEIEQFERAAARRGITLTTFEGLDLKDDLSDVIDLIAALDAVVTPMTSTAFMAGVLGVPTWVFRTSEFKATWHQLGTPHIPWIPEIKLCFRDPRVSWDDVIMRIHDDLLAARNWLLSRRS